MQVFPDSALYHPPRVISEQRGMKSLNYCYVYLTNVFSIHLTYFNICILYHCFIVHYDSLLTRIYNLLTYFCIYFYSFS